MAFIVLFTLLLFLGLGLLSLVPITNTHDFFFCRVGLAWCPFWVFIWLKSYRLFCLLGEQNLFLLCGAGLLFVSASVVFIALLGLFIHIMTFVGLCTLTWLFTFWGLRQLRLRRLAMLKDGECIRFFCQRYCSEWRGVLCALAVFFPTPVNCSGCSGVSGGLHSGFFVIVWG